jgi:hypothetical protein
MQPKKNKLENLTKDSFINMEHMNAKKQEREKQNEYNSKNKKTDTATIEDIAKTNARNNFTAPKDLKKEPTSLQITKQLSETLPLLPNDYQIGLNDVNELIENYSKMDKDDVIDKKTAQKLNSQLMKYDTKLANFKANTKIKTVINKLNDFKTLIDAQVVANNATGLTNESTISTKKQKDSLIPIPSKK